jgi:hypothetical protein
MASRVLELRLGFLLGLLSGRCAFAASARGCQKSVGCHAARSYSWMRPVGCQKSARHCLPAVTSRSARWWPSWPGTRPAPPNATRGHRPRPCGPPTETCSPSPAAANSPGPFPSAHRYGGGRQRGGLEAHRAMSGLDQRPASGAPTRTQADQLGDTVNTSRPAASDAGGSRGRSRSPWRHRRSSWWWCYHPRRRCWACWSMASQSGRSVQAGSAIGCHPPARLVSTRSRSASST